jgi:hypothetical protein
MVLSTTPNRKRPIALAMAAVLGAAVTVAPLREARADDVSPNGKGIVGGALLGAEVPVIIEGIAGVRSGWVYGISAVVGGAGGAVGGWAVQNSSPNGQGAMYMLAGGLALVIPAVVLMLNGTRYQPEEGLTEDRVPVGPAAEPGAPGGSSVQPGVPGAAPAAPPPPPPAPPPPPPSAPQQSLLDVHQGTFRMGIPVPDVRPVFSATEMRSYGVKDNAAALHMPVLNLVF